MPSQWTSLTLIAHGSSGAARRGEFPLDEPLDRFGQRDCAMAAGALRRFDQVWIAPELRTRQTAEALGLAGPLETALRDLDCGQWRGKKLSALEPPALQAWLSDPDAAPHGGESLRALVHRVAQWIEQRRRDEKNVAAVTHPLVVRAAVLNAIGAPAESMQRVDVAPLTAAVLTFSDRWRLRSLAPLAEPPAD